MTKNEKKLKTQILEKIINSYDKKNNGKSIYKNFNKNKFDFNSFLTTILKDTNNQNSFVTNIINEFKEILLSINIDYKEEYNPNTLNFEKYLKINLNIYDEEKNINDENEIKENIDFDINKMLRKYFKKNYNLPKVDKFIEILTKSISITNDNKTQINNELIKDILDLNTKFKSHQNPEIQKLADELEEHLNPKGNPEPPKRDLKPDNGMELS